MDQDYGLTSSRGGFHPGLASSTSSSSLSGVAQGGIYGLASSYGELHPGFASYKAAHCLLKPHRVAFMVWCPQSKDCVPMLLL